MLEKKNNLYIKTGHTYRVYKKQVIGNTRFPEDLKIAEDLMFNSKIKPKTHSSIKKQIYWYTIRPDSLSRSGE